jgi:two-component system nitrogen regulation response regulator NtrX
LEVRSHNSPVSQEEHLAEILKFPLREARELFERYYLSLQLNRFNGNVSQTALFVGMERSALHRKLKLLGIMT